MRPSLRRRALFSTAAVLVVSACADSSPSSTETADHGPVDARCQRVADAARWEGVVTAGVGATIVDEHDDYFSPTCIRVPWNTPVKLVVTNFGHMPHTVTVRGTRVDVDVDAGQTSFVTLPATKVPLQIVCTFHIDQRMFAAVIPVRGTT
jgi:hypothetical protein